MIESQVALAVLTKDAPQSAVRAAQSSRLRQERIIVVSNGSCDQADAELAKALPKANIRPVRPARGISYCLNLGIRLPAELKWHPQPEWSVLTQDDIAFDKDWLVTLTAAIAAKPRALQVNMAYPKSSYSCIAIHRDLVRKIGWWDERFTGMFYEDDDWHLRLCEYARCPPGTRVHESDNGGIFASAKCALHDDKLRRLRAADRKRFGFKTTLSKAPNEKFFYEKWARVKKGGWRGKGLPGLFRRRLAEVEWHPMALLGGALQ